MEAEEGFPGYLPGKRRKEERFKAPLRQSNHLNLEMVTDQHFKVGELAGVGETLMVKRKLEHDALGAECPGEDTLNFRCLRDTLMQNRYIQPFPTCLP